MPSALFRYSMCALSRYSIWQGNDLSGIKNFLNFHLLLLNIPSLPTLSINYIKSGQNWFCSNTLLLIHCCKG